MATRKADIEKAIREIISHLDLKPIGDTQVPGKRATIAFLQFASKAAMWGSIMKIKSANLKIPETGEALWASQSKSREDRIRGRKISSALRLTKEFVASHNCGLQEDELDADYRSGKYITSTAPSLPSTC